jgi:polar amino acid transport system substrate-binding protein
MRITIARRLAATAAMLLLPLGALAQADTLVFATTALPPFGSLPGKPGFLEQVAREAFRRLGRKIEVDTLPGDRPLLSANAGLIDGDLFRTPGFEKEYPNLVRVPEVMGQMEFMAYTMRPGLVVRDWKDLEPLTVGFATGWKIYERRVKAREITRVSTIEELFPLLARKRADVVLADRWQGMWAAKSGGYRLRPLEPPLATHDMFMYVHKRHAALVPRIAATLAAMKADGSYRRIHEATLGPVVRK